jgi:hypothetical protein
MNKTTTSLLMRHCFLCIFLLASVVVSAQNKITRTRKIVPLFTQQNFFLDGGVGATFGGKSRVTFQITLPRGTVEWYYTVTTTPGQPSEDINLIPQLTKLLDPSGTTSIIASAILAPTGANVVDCLLMTGQDQQSFLAMADIGTVRRYVTDSRLNFRSGTIQVKDVIMSGIYILGFRNPSRSPGIGVSFEAAAIVEELSVNPDAEKAVNYGNLGWKAFETGDVTKCIEYSKKALSLDNSLGYVKANLGLCYLIQNDEITATEYYIEALSDIKKMPNKADRSLTLNAAIKDINEVLKKQLTLKGADGIKSMYKNELVRSIVN